ncbi:MAG TPA: hypothetical protein VED18_09555 [Candidatus Sulfotelmatobacter sp.]|nr:hypothetical protein [Candidatus Sulfotelmatobacter sp.]
MKKLALVTVLLVGLLLPFTAQPASAGNGGAFWGGFGAGTATGLFVGTALAPRYYAPAPVYVVPQTVCQDYVTQGYWRQVTVTDPSGAPMVQNQWVPGSVQRVCQ